MEAIILAGGLGTRLRAVTNGLPKPMAPINSEPFLAVLLNTLVQQGIDRVILSVGYKAEVIESYFGDRYRTCKLIYSTELEPLGTGGAIRQALELVQSEHVFVLNGDTMFRVPLLTMMRFHQERQADLSIALKPMSDFDRYGNVVLSETRIIQFEEKQYCSHGNINGGVYLLQRNLIERFGFPSKFSFEADFLQPCINQLQVHGFVHDTYFIDIGIPEDYQRAQQELGT